MVPWVGLQCVIKATSLRILIKIIFDKHLTLEVWLRKFLNYHFLVTELLYAYNMSSITLESVFFSFFFVFAIPGYNDENQHWVLCHL